MKIGDLVEYKKRLYFVENVHDGMVDIVVKHWSCDIYEEYIQNDEIATEWIRAHSVKEVDITLIKVIREGG